MTSKTKKINKKVVPVVGVVLVVLVVVLKSYVFSVTETSAEKELRAIKEKQKESEALAQYAIDAMQETVGGRKLSDVRKQVLARSIARISDEVFDSYVNKKAFVVVLAIESQFQKFAQSPTGPKGLTQVAKAAFKDGLEKCGVDTVDDSDVWNEEINLLAGACYFQEMLEDHDNDPMAAIVAYNQGPNSHDAKSYAKSGSADEKEALKYIAKFSFLSHKIPDNTPKPIETPLQGFKNKVSGLIDTVVSK